MGLSYKQDSDDIRNSPAKKILKNLLKSDHKILIVEPNIKKDSFFKLTNLNKAIKQADIVAILVKHKEFIKPNIKKKLSMMNCLDFCDV